MHEDLMDKCIYILHWCGLLVLVPLVAPLSFRSWFWMEDLGLFSANTRCHFCPVRPHRGQFVLFCFCTKASLLSLPRPREAGPRAPEACRSPSRRFSLCRGADRLPSPVVSGAEQVLGIL